MTQDIGFTTAVQYELWQRPLPELQRIKWQELWQYADRVRRDYFGRPYYEDDEGYACLIQWHPDGFYKGTHYIYGVRRSEPYYADDRTVEQWFAEVNISGQPGGYVAKWLVRLDQLRAMAGES